MITFDKDNDFSPIPEGTYQATVYDAKVEAEEGRKPCLSVQFRVSDDSHQNRRVWQRYWFTPKSVWRLKQLLVATGQLNDSFSGSFDETQIPGLITGEAVTIEVGIDEYNGKTRNEVNAVKAALSPF